MSKLFKTAFTLIELLVVIAVIGILSGLIVVATNGMTSSATVAKAKVFSNSIGKTFRLNSVSEWKFDELSSALNGQSIQDTWGVNNGTLSTGDANNKLTTNCVYGKCLYFDGGNDYINCGSGALNIRNNFTIEAWIKDIYTTTSQCIVSNDRDMSPPSGGLDLRINAAHYLYGFIWKNSDSLSIGVTSDTFVPDNAWQHIVFTFNGTDLILYQDGQRTGIQTIPLNSIKTAPYNLMVGVLGYSAPTWLRFKGYIDEIRIYSAAISVSKIKEEYYSGLNNMLFNGNISKEEYLNRIKQTSTNEQSN
jgi:prepilin-type N-terminal cleavage/methylation domain-containing protein